MPILIALIGAAVDVKNATRRFDFRRRANQYPVEAIDDPELAILGRWFVEACRGNTQTFPRLAKKLRKLDGASQFNDLMAVLTDIAQTSAGGPSTRQSETLSDLARVFGLK